MTASQSLGGSARAAMLWGGGFTILRDVVQFAVMLVLVRLLSPADYGAAALAQTIIGVASVVSFATFSLHALQIRDPAAIDWQAQFTAAVCLNGLVAGLTVLVAGVLYWTNTFREAALPLAALALVFVIEAPGTLRQRMLEVTHDWKRLRVLLMLGTILGLGSGLLVGLMGGGVWALIIQPPMLSLPAVVDLFVGARFRPRWTWDWPGYRDTAHFGLNRIASGGLARGRQLVEQVALAAAFNVATLGIFTRALGLAALLAGRIASVAMMSLYPVITRAERGSDRFRRIAGLVLRGVCWTTIPAAALLAITARDVVHVLYGSKWDAVASLLPFAAVTVGLGGVTTALSSLLLANENTNSLLKLDVAIYAVAIALALLVMPFGPQVYLAALTVHALAATAVTSVLLVNKGAISARGVGAALGPSLAAAGAGMVLAELASRMLAHVEPQAIRLIVETAVFGAVYVVTLRVAFSRPLADLLDVVPGGGMLARTLWLARGQAVAKNSQ
ncbi:MAG: oligosaccharide flippase family protein [Phenylobacterium sp.]